MSFLFRRKKKDDDEKVDPNARSEKLGIKYKDLALLGQLIQSGADVRLPRHAIFFLYFPSREIAETAAGEGRAAGYSCEVRDPLPQQPTQWSLVCERNDAVLSPQNVIAADNLFQELADRLGGDFDGWEAAAKP